MFAHICAWQTVCCLNPKCVLPMFPCRPQRRAPHCPLRSLTVGRVERVPSVSPAMARKRRAPAAPAGDDAWVTHAEERLGGADRLEAHRHEGYQGARDRWNELAAEFSAETLARSAERTVTTTRTDGDCDDDVKRTIDALRSIRFEGEIKSAGHNPRDYTSIIMGRPVQVRRVASLSPFRM